MSCCRLVRLSFFSRLLLWLIIRPLNLGVFDRSISVNLLPQHCKLERCGVKDRPNESNRLFAHLSLTSFGV